MPKTILSYRGLVAAYAVLLAILTLGLNFYAGAEVSRKWKIHDVNRPQPPVVTPATASTQERPGRPPSDAIVLFGGKDLAAWRAADGGPAKWKVEGGYMEAAEGAGDIHTQQAFGDCQLHVEWAAPNPPVGGDYNRGNSGVFLMGLYELQVFDSYQHKIYADGEAGSMYGQYPPLANASLPPGQWQTFDVVFHGPRFDTNGKLLDRAFITVLHNGVLVQDHSALTGPSGHKQRPPYKAHPAKLPLSLQEHHNPVRYRNIWIRELAEPDD